MEKKIVIIVIIAIMITIVLLLMGWLILRPTEELITEDAGEVTELEHDLQKISPELDQEVVGAFAEDNGWVKTNRLTVAQSESGGSFYLYFEDEIMQNVQSFDIFFDDIQYHSNGNQFILDTSMFNRIIQEINITAKFDNGETQDFSFDQCLFLNMKRKISNQAIDQLDLVENLWVVSAVKEKKTDIISSCISLTNLEIDDCSKLDDFSFLSGLESITSLKLENVSTEELAVIHELPNLKSLYLGFGEGVDNINCLAIETLSKLTICGYEGTELCGFANASSLRQLALIELSNVIKISTTGLKSLSINNCSEIEVVECEYDYWVNPESLIELNIKDCENLHSITGGFDDYYHLHMLGLENLPNLEDVDALGNAYYLRDVRMKNMTKLKKLGKMEARYNLKSGIVEGCSFELSDILATSASQFDLENILEEDLMNKEYITAVSINMENRDVDLSLLTEFENIKKCTIHTTGEVKNIGVLAQLEYLEELDLFDEDWLCAPKFTDISFLLDLKGLKGLEISLEGVEDLTPLGELKQLESLRVYDLEADIPASIGQLTKLENLYLNSFYIKDENGLDALKLIPNLKDLSMVVGGCYSEDNTERIIDMSFASEMTALEDIWFSGVSLGKLGSLADLTNLQEISLSYIPDDIAIEALCAPNIKTVKIYGWRESYTAWLLQLDAIEELKISEDILQGPLESLTSIEFILDIPTMKRLYLNSEELEDYSPIAQAKNLEEVTIIAYNVNKEYLSDLRSLDYVEIYE